MKIITSIALIAVSVLFVTAGSNAQNVFVAASGNVYEIMPDGTPSLFASGDDPIVGLAFNSSGNLFAITIDGNVYEFGPNGTQSAFATGLSTPQGLTFDNAGNLYVSQNNGEIIEITTNGTKNVFAYGFSDPVGLAFDNKGDLFVSARHSNSIFEIYTNGSQSTVASGLSGPLILAFDGAKDLFVANAVGNVIEINTNGIQSFFASSLVGPSGLAFDSTGNLFEADSGNIHKFTPNGTKTTITYGLNYGGLAIQPLPQLQAVMTNSACQVTISMPSPYFSTILQASTDMVNWFDVCTDTPPFMFNDSACSQFPFRFFRTSSSP